MLISGVSGTRRRGRHLLTVTAALNKQTYTDEWETFLTRELPSHLLSADKQIKSNKDFQDAYRKAGGSNASSHFPPAGNHVRPHRAAQLQALKPDLIATING